MCRRRWPKRGVHRHKLTVIRLTALINERHSFITYTGLSLPVRKGLAIPALVQFPAPGIRFRIPNDPHV